MIRVLSILAAVAALAVSAAPVASAFVYVPEECMVTGVKAAPPKPPQSSHTLKDCMISGYSVTARSDEGQRAKKGLRPNKGQGQATATWDLASNKG